MAYRFIYMVNLNRGNDVGLSIVKCKNFRECETDTQMILGYIREEKPKLKTIEKSWLVRPLDSLVESGCIFATTERGVIENLQKLQREVGLIEEIVEMDLE